MLLAQGKTLKNGEYEVIREIDSGGMSVIYEAKRSNSCYAVIVKHLSFHNASNPNYKTENEEMFQREGELLKQLNSRIFPDYLDSFEENGEKYLVMEYIKGQNLYEIITQNGKLGEEEVKQVGLTLLEATGCIHQLNYIHRDIAPDNVLKDKNGQIRLIDLGIAYPIKSSKNQEEWGKPPWIAPEQWAGRAEKRSDLYSIARTMQFLLTGNSKPKPFDIDESLKQIAPNLVKFLVKAMSYDPKDRYQTTEQMARALKGIKIRKPKPQKQVTAVQKPTSSPSPIKIWEGRNCFMKYMFGLWHALILYTPIILLFVCFTLNYVFGTFVQFLKTPILVSFFIALLSLLFAALTEKCILCFLLNCLCVPINLLRLLWQKIKALQIGSKIWQTGSKIIGCLKKIKVGDWNDAKRFLLSSWCFYIPVIIISFVILVLLIALFLYLLFGINFGIFSPYNPPLIKLSYETPIKINQETEIRWTTALGDGYKIYLITPNGEKRQLNSARNDRVRNGSFNVILTKPTTLKFLIQWTGGQSEYPRSELFRLIPVEPENFLDGDKPLKF